MKRQILLSFSILLIAFTAISAQQLPKTISGGVLNGKAVNLPNPEVPASAKVVKACGAVNVQIIIDEKGYVESAEATSGHPLLRSAAVEAARNAKFEPTFLSGEPVRVSGVLTYVFHCDAGSSSTSKEDFNNGSVEATPESNKTYDSPGIIRGGVINGKALSLPKPEYSAAAKEAGIAGKVEVKIVLDEEGKVISAEAISGHSSLRTASEKAAMLAKFAPTKLSGVPVKVSGIIVYNFVQSENVGEIPKELLYLGLGTFLTASRYQPVEEWEPFTKDYLDDVPELANELQPLILISKTTTQKEKIEILNKVLNSLQDKLTGENAWQFQFGRTFGELMSEFVKTIENPELNVDIVTIKTKLLQMNDLILSAPRDFPPKLLAKFKELSQFGKKKEFTAGENFVQLGKVLMEVFEIISPDSEVE